VNDRVDLDGGGARAGITGRAPGDTDGHGGDLAPGPPATDDPVPDRRDADRPIRAVYADLRYRDIFWTRRPYEDAADRSALRALLPRGRGHLLDVGAGYGRLVAEYTAFERIVLLDASPVHVEAARERFATDTRVTVLEADAAAIPLEDASVDVAVCVRLVHHLEDPRPVLAEIARVLRPGGVLVLEAANKRNVKAIARWLLGRQRWSPFAPGPATYRPFHHDHAPGDIERWLDDAGLRVERRLTVSLFRARLLTSRVAPETLVRLERPLRSLLAPLTPGPSLFVRARRSAGSFARQGDRSVDARGGRPG
jgi:SAM-dependent methyltransferase